MARRSPRGGRGLHRYRQGSESRGIPWGVGLEGGGRFCQWAVGPKKDVKLKGDDLGAVVSRRRGSRMNHRGGGTGGPRRTAPGGAAAEGNRTWSKKGTDPGW